MEWRRGLSEGRPVQKAPREVKALERRHTAGEKRQLNQVQKQREKPRPVSRLADLRALVENQQDPG